MNTSSYILLFKRRLICNTKTLKKYFTEFKNNNKKNPSTFIIRGKKQVMMYNFDAKLTISLDRVITN